MKNNFRYALETKDKQKGHDIVACESLQQAQELWQSSSAKEKPAVIDVVTGRTILKKG